MSNDVNREREVLSQLYANEADVVKYLPFFFSDMEQLKAFFDYFSGKTLKIPDSYQEFLESFLIKDKYTPNKKLRGIHCLRKMKPKILESYLGLFPSLESVIKNECGKK